MSEQTPTTPARPARPEKPKRRLGLWIGLAATVVVAVVAAVTIPALTASKEAPAEEGAAAVQTVKLGVNDIGAGHWEILVDLAKEEGIDVELISFTDYNTPNPALDAGDVDMNKFQHLRFLGQFNATQGAELVPLGSTQIFPIGFFSKKWTSVDEIPQGAEATLSNNPANQVRPLLALHNAGLIEFTKPADWSVTIDDVDYAKSKLGKLTPMIRPRPLRRSTRSTSPSSTPRTSSLQASPSNSRFTSKTQIAMTCSSTSTSSPFGRKTPTTRH